MIKFSIEAQGPEDGPQIEAMLDASFGIGRRVKSSYRLREQELPVAGLSFVARDEAGTLLGAISFWHLRVGAEGVPGLLLGPLAVHPDFQNRGIGLALMRHGIEAARGQGHKLILLVGDGPYYARAGFQPVPAGQLQMPGPFDPKRLLALELVPHALEGVSGLILPPHRFNALRAARLNP